MPGATQNPAIELPTALSLVYAAYKAREETLMQYRRFIGAEAVSPVRLCWGLVAELCVNHAGAASAGAL